MFTNILQKMLKLDLILQIMNYIDHCIKSNERVIVLMEDGLEEIMVKFVGLRAKTYNYLIGCSNEDSKPKGTKMILKLLLNTQMIRTNFIKLLKNAIQITNAIY